MLSITLVCTLALSASASPADSYTSKIKSTPDYTQTDPAYGALPDGGKNYCGAVSVSNSLIWLADNGYPALAPRTKDRKHDQFILAKTLGEKYMDSIDGTSPRHLSRGLKQYIEKCGYSVKRIECQGWRAVDRQFKTDVKIPDLDWIKKGVDGNGAVWVNVGWYKYDEKTDTYKRFGGHWITIVGYGHDGKKKSPDYLIANDPSPRAGRKSSNEYIKPQPITTGTLKEGAKEFPLNAAGYYKMTDGMHLNHRADVGILDCAIILEMNPPEQTDKTHTPAQSGERESS